ncbi:hypothetical protein CPT_Shaeky_055 [Streptomyces phage Shaeky]|uniref:Uncharacterized protein n=1 Tax=Streptomyces phage Shaeky TaxID=2767586 RepID=A0A873WL92_9CAUD|nr:hypothetical protein CPT_Shaeky_055 [Streptomyces phage Shaeky]
MKRQWRRDVSVPGRWNVQSIILRTRYTEDVRVSVTLTQSEVGEVPTKTRAVFDSILDVLDYADELDADLRAEGWERVTPRR